MAFDPKKEALMKMRGKKDLAPKGEEPQNPQDAEQAPELGQDVPHGTPPMMEAGGQPQGDILEQIPPELLMQIIEALMDRSSHPGRAAGSLGERAAANAKGKMDSMQAKKEVV